MKISTLHLFTQLLVVLVHTVASRAVEPETTSRQTTLSPELWATVVRSVYFSRLVYDDEASIAQVGAANYFDDNFDDAALIAVEDDGTTTTTTRCFVTFRGSAGETFVRDWRQNLQFRRRSFCNKVDSEYCCEAPKGQISAYETNYQEEFEARLESLCADKDEVVFTGYSQGAAVAELASLRFSHWNPKVILFAPPSVTVENPCLRRSITNEILNVINTDSRGVLLKQLVYDPIVSGSSRLFKNYLPEGRAIILPPDDSTGVAHYEDGSYPQLINSPATVRFGIHFPYLERVQALDAATGGLGPDLGGFVAGTPCRVDTECSSGSCESAFPLILGLRKYKSCS